MVQQTVAEAFKLRILDLLTEFFAHAFRVLAALEHARTVAACAFQSVLNSLDDFRIRIECYFHVAIISYRLAVSLLGILDVRKG